MTESERAWTEEVRSAAFKMLAAAANLETDLPEGPEKRRAKRLETMAMALVSLAGRRLGQAELAADHAEVTTAGYDLAALATAPPSHISE